MLDFSVIQQDPKTRELVQSGLLERKFHQALFPKLQYRAEMAPKLWMAESGDSIVQTGVGLISPKQRPMVPGTDPQPSTYNVEQWEGQVQQYGDTTDVHMPSSDAAIASLLLQGANAMAQSAGIAVNRLSRNHLFRIGLSGHTVSDG